MKALVELVANFSDGSSRGVLESDALTIEVSGGTYNKIDDSHGEILNVVPGQEVSISVKKSDGSVVGSTTFNWSVELTSVTVTVTKAE